MSIPFLHPSWLGIALALALVLPLLIPVLSQRWWLVITTAVVGASIAAGLGLVPWFGHLQMTAYGICLLIAVVTAYALMVPRARVIGIPERRVMDLAFIALTAGLIGARSFEIWDHWDDYAHPHGQPFSLPVFLARAPDIDQGGMVWYGGAIFGAIGVLIYARRCRLPWLPLADVVMPALLAALAIGRIGCFFNGCCYGAVCDPQHIPWAIHTPGDHGHVAWRHPAQLYETLAGSLLALGCWLRWKWRRSDGEVAALAISGYVVWRFVNEILREDKVMTTLWGIWPISTAQVISVHVLIVVVMVSLVTIWRRRSNPEMDRLARLVPGSRHASPEIPLAQPNGCEH